MVSHAVCGCDCCRKQISEENKLGITVFYNNEELIKNNTGRDTDSFEFCSWTCIFEYLPKIETDYFMTFPHVIFQKDGNNSKELIDLLLKKNCAMKASDEIKSELIKIEKEFNRLVDFSKTNPSCKSDVLRKIMCKKAEIEKLKWVLKK